MNFKDNQIYNLSDSAVRRELSIKDAMKTMDNRIKIDPELLKEYMLRG